MCASVRFEYVVAVSIAATDAVSFGSNIVETICPGLSPGTS